MCSKSTYITRQILEYHPRLHYAKPQVSTLSPSNSVSQLWTTQSAMWYIVLKFLAFVMPNLTNGHLPCWLLFCILLGCLPLLWPSLISRIFSRVFSLVSLSSHLLTLTTMCGWFPSQCNRLSPNSTESRFPYSTCASNFIWRPFKMSFSISVKLPLPSYCSNQKSGSHSLSSAPTSHLLGSPAHSTSYIQKPIIYLHPNGASLIHRQTPPVGLLSPPIGFLLTLLSTSYVLHVF